MFFDKASIYAMSRLDQVNTYGKLSALDSNESCLLCGLV